MRNKQIEEKAITRTIVIRNVDLRLLARQVGCLSAVQEYLKTGEPSPHADDWPEALEGLLNLLAAREEKPGGETAVQYAAYVGRSAGQWITLHGTYTEALGAVAEGLGIEDRTDALGVDLDDEDLEARIEDHCNDGADAGDTRWHIQALEVD